ncbi:MAG: hypothetical protein ACI97A_001654 [Planctomycetota bacterium]|jgi:hypothetical protein
MNDRSKEKFLTSRVKLGFMIGAACHFCGMLIYLIISAFDQWGALMLFLIGFGQLLYMVPAVLFAWWRGADKEFLKGMAISAGLMLLINGTCFGVGIAWISVGGEIGG